MKLEFLDAGEIVTTHGVRGEMKVLPWADGPEFLLDFKRVRIAGIDYKVESCRVQKTCNLVKLAGIDTMEQAQAMHGKDVKVVLLYNMMGGAWATEFETVAENMGLYTLKTIRDNSGGNSHPSAEAHETIAGELTAFLQSTVLK